jgi:hypothetical protein
MDCKQVQITRARSPVSYSAEGFKKNKNITFYLNTFYFNTFYRIMFLFEISTGGTVIVPYNWAHSFLRAPDVTLEWESWDLPAELCQDSSVGNSRLYSTYYLYYSSCRLLYLTFLILLKLKTKKNANIF